MDVADGQAGLQAIEPGAVRYIKLGDGGRWATEAIEAGYLAFGYRRIPHTVALAGTMTKSAGCSPTASPRARRRPA